MKETIKSLAKDAKQRLRLSNYFQKTIPYNDCENQTTQSYIKSQNQKLLSSNCIDNEEQILWQKVCDIMESEQDIINPISILIDKEKYNNMSEIARQMYVLRLSDKYAELKQRYITEHKILA